MNKIITLIAVMLFATVAFAQAPDKMSYQSVIRDTKGVLVSDQTVTVQISILKGSQNGEAVYVETHRSATNKNGLVTLQIGGGDVFKGTFADINWSDETYNVCYALRIVTSNAVD